MKQNGLKSFPFAIRKLTSSLKLLMLSFCLFILPSQSHGQTSDSGNDDSNWEEVTVWAASGYDGAGKRIGIDWYETEAEAQAAAEKMRAIEVTNGKFYAKVEVTSERERVRKKKNLPPRESRKPDEPLSGPKKPAFIVPRQVEIPSVRLDSPAKNPNSVAGKKGKGKVAGKNMEFDFEKDGSFVIRDPDANSRIIAKGDWSQTGSAVSIRTETFLYMGTVKGDAVSGKRVQRGTGADVHDWSIKFSEDNTDLIGKWRVRGSADDKWELQINSDGTVRFKQTYVGWVNGVWTGTGGVIQITTDGGWTGKHNMEFKGRLSNGELSGKKQEPRLNSDAYSVVFVKMP